MLTLSERNKRRMIDATNDEDVVPESKTALHLAAERGDEKSMADLLAHSCPSLVDAVDSSGKTALHYAARFGHVGIMMQLVDLNPGLVDVVDSRGWTVLHLGAEMGHDHVVEYLIEHWPALVKDHGSSYTALDVAADAGHEKVVARLLALDPSLVDCEASWRNPVINGYDKVLEQMLPYNPSLIGSDGESALHIAASMAHKKVVSLLLAHRPELLDLRDACGLTPLHSAVSCQVSLPIVAQLLERKPELITAVESFGETAFHYAIRSDRPDVMSQLLLRDPSLLDTVNMGGRNALHMAAERGSKRALEMVLISRPQFVFGVDNEANTVLHALVESRASCRAEAGSQCLERLYELHADALRSTNKRGKTPFDFAFHAELNWAIDFLQWKVSLAEIEAANESHPHRNSDRFERFRPLVEEQCECLQVLLHPHVVGTVYEYLGFKPQRAADKRKTRGTVNGNEERERCGVS